MMDVDEPTLPEPARHGIRGPELVAGTRLGGRYLLIEELGRGATSVVHRARDTELEREVAVKVLLQAHADADLLDALRGEARSVAALDHPHVATIHDVGVHEGRPFLVMSHAGTRSLSQVLRERERLELDEILALTEQLASALDHAHARGIVHADVKPSNVLLDEESRASLVDFGIARRLHARDGARTAGLGTPGFVAPEVVRGEQPSPRSDVLGLGAVLYRALTGRPPLADDGAPIDPAVGLESREVPRAVAAVVARALAVEPTERQASAGALARDLQRAIARTRRRRGPIWLAAAGLLAAAALAGALGASRPLTLESQLWASRVTDGRQTAVQISDDAVLQSGDRVWLDGLRVNRTAGVGVLLLSSKGELTPVYPLEGAASRGVEPGRTHRVPSAEAWTLDDAPGVETLYVVASVEPLTHEHWAAALSPKDEKGRPLRTRGLLPARPHSDERLEQEERLRRALADRFDAVRVHRIVHR